MRRIAHLSDLHFGTTDSTVAGALLNDLAQQQVHLTVVSGDLTQRARRVEFQAARQYLDRIAGPRLIVPGNHDIPLYNVLARFLRPLSRFQAAITEDLNPVYRDSEILVVGVNTARSNTWKSGRISQAQIESLRSTFEAAGDLDFKVLVSHHPFIPPEGHPTGTVVGRSLEALHMLQQVGCSLILSGHLHQAFSSDVRPYHLEIERSILVAQAGTALSNRRRGEANGYNLIMLDGSTLTLEVRAWTGRQFEPSRIRRFQSTATGWVPDSAPL